MDQKDYRYLHGTTKRIMLTEVIFINLDLHPMKYINIKRLRLKIHHGSRCWIPVAPDQTLTLSNGKKSNVLFHQPHRPMRFWPNKMYLKHLVQYEKFSKVKPRPSVIKSSENETDNICTAKSKQITVKIHIQRMF